MNNFYCNKCKKEVGLYNGRCPICKTNWEKIEEKGISNTNSKSKITNNYSSINDIEETCVCFLQYAETGKTLHFALAFLVAIFAIINVESTNGYSLIALLFAGLLILCGIIFEKNIKWKAYMLRTNYEIAKNKPQKGNN